MLIIQLHVPIKRYKIIVNQHLIPKLGQILSDKLKSVHLQSYYSNCLESGRKDGTGGLSAQTVLHHHRLLHEANH